ncbi:hypothetical protein [Streptomyces althioticus]|uniref:hypothetical protein n=1 Tax=Streptomyces althioticus TaxID=83380 RepID=UPI0033EB5979
MKKNKRSNGSNGFGLQKEITGDGAVILLRITNPRRLNVESLGKTLMKFFQGGYKTLILDQGKSGRVKLSLLEFLGRLEATFREGRLFSLERKLRSDRVRF